MKYEDCRDRMRTGDLISFEGDAFFSRLIQWWTRSSVSHSAMIWRDVNDEKRRVWIIESMEGKGVGTRALSQVGDFKWCPVKSTVAQREALKADFFIQDGRISYSKVGILRQIFGSLIGGELDSKRTICSRFVSWHYYTNLGLKWIAEAPPPSELERLIELHGVDTKRGDGSVRVVNGKPKKIDLSR